MACLPIMGALTGVGIGEHRLYGLLQGRHLTLVFGKYTNRANNLFVFFFFNLTDEGTILNRHE